MNSALEKPHILYDHLNTIFTYMGVDAPFFNWGYESSLQSEGLKSSLSAHECLVAELIGSESLQGKRVLDVGCGRGGALHYMSCHTQPLSLTGIDINSTNIQTARRLLADTDARLHLGDACHLPFPNKSSDVIFNLESSGGYPDMIAFLRHVSRILDTGGVFLHGDIWPCDLVDNLKKTMEALGFICEEIRNVSYEVCQARTKADPSFLQRLNEILEWELDTSSALEDYFALPGSAMWSCLEHGSATYLLTRWRRLDKPEIPEEWLTDPTINTRTQRMEELLRRQRLFLEERQEKFPFNAPKSHTDVNILAFPYAFAGASIYRNWTTHFPSTWNFCPVQLPARENRITDPPITSISEIVDEILPYVIPHLSTPLILLGWCLGGTIAFELCMRLEEKGFSPRVVILGMCTSPEHKYPPTETFFDAQKGIKLQAPQGMLLDPILEMSEMLDILKDCIQNDIYLATTYDRSEGKIQTPLVALAGYDDPVAPPHAVETWRNWGAHSFEFHRVNGTHFAPRDSSEEMALLVRTLIEKYLEQ